MANNEETVTIAKAEYDRLIRADRWLDCLDAAGVDNWEGYEIAQDYLTEKEAKNGNT